MLTDIPKPMNLLRSFLDSFIVLIFLTEYNECLKKIVFSILRFIKFPIKFSKTKIKVVISDVTVFPH